MTNVVVAVRFNNVDAALRQMKRKMQREGIFRILKLKRFYEKPSEMRVRKQEESVRRRHKLARRYITDGY
ncbi:30S ribosomal protein S21 [Alphaproteobacteria bacterium]